MELQKKITNDYITAFKSKNESYKVLNLLRAAIKQVEVDTRKSLTDEDIVNILKKESKKRKDSIQAYKDGNREDLAKIEEYELEIISNYLPEQLDETTIKTIAENIISKNELTIQDMGRTIGLVMKEAKTKGDVDGNIVQSIVKDILQNK